MMFAQILKEKVIDVFFSLDHELFNQSLFFLYPLYFLAAATNPLSSFLQLFDWSELSPFLKAAFNDYGNPYLQLYSR